MARNSTLGIPVLVSSLWLALLACRAEDTGGEADPPIYQTVPCPAAEPTVGAKCTGPMDCEYGDAVRPECRARFGCAETTDWRWQEAADCTEAPAGFCPDTRPGETPCTPPISWAACEYGNAVCVCPCDPPLEGDGHCAPGLWACFDPPTTEGCPTIAPNYGSPCSVQGLECNYGNVCDWGYSRFCYKGLWVTGSNGGLVCHL